MPGSSAGWPVPQSCVITPTKDKEREAKKDARHFPVLVLSFLARVPASCLLWKELQVPSVVFSWKGALQAWDFMETSCLRSRDAFQKKPLLDSVFPKVYRCQAPSIASSEARGWLFKCIQRESDAHPLSRVIGTPNRFCSKDSTPVCKGHEISMIQTCWFFPMWYGVMFQTWPEGSRTPSHTASTRSTLCEI